MKKTVIKKALTAFGVACAAVALSVSSVFAAAQSYVFSDVTEMSTFDYSAGGTIVTGLDWVKGSATWQNDATKGVGVKLGGTSNSGRRMFKVSAEANEKIVVSFCAQTDAATADCVIANSATGMVKNGANETGVYATANATGYTPGEVSLDVLTAGEYYIGSPGVKSTILSIKVENGGPVTESLQYNEGNVFAVASTDTTVGVVDPTATSTDSIVGTDLLAAVTTAGEAAYVKSDGTVTEDILVTGLNGDNVSANGKITFGTGKYYVVSPQGAIKTNGSGRTISVVLAEGEAVKLSNYKTGSTGVTGRNMVLEGVKYEAPLEAQDTVMTVSKAGTYEITCDANVNFTEISIIPAKQVKVPTVTLSNADTTTYAGKVAFTGTISGDGDESQIVNAINFAYAKGAMGISSSDAPAAKSVAITSVAENADGTYSFVAVVDADKINALPGFKAQASIDYGASKTYYSNVVEYIPVN